MTRVTREARLEPGEIAAVLEPRCGFVVETQTAPGEFTALVGPFTEYRRSVEVDGATVRQTVDFRLAIPFFWPLFFLPARRLLASMHKQTSTPWWAPPEALDARASRALASVAAMSLVCGYLGTMLTQTLTFAADEFHRGLPDAESVRLQGLTLAFIRLDVVIALLVVARADRKGRRTVLLVSAVAGCILTAACALAPTLQALAVLQIGARGFVTAALVVISIIAAEEMPAGARAYALGLLAMAGALGAGQCVLLLFVADTGVRAWRILYALGLVWLVVVWLVSKHLQESRRYRMPHPDDVKISGHSFRFWLLAISGLLIAVFSVPASQFQNEFLRDERGFSAARISLFTILTATPGAIGIVVGGRLADIKGRRLVGAVSIVGGVGCTVAMFLASGWPIWAISVAGSILGAAFVPALGVYGPELFPTGMRGKANGIITALARVGSVVGLVAVGFLVNRFGSIGPALAVLSIGPAILVILVLTLYPETAHKELEELNPEDLPPPAVLP